jgi:hypothetical protein
VDATRTICVPSFGSELFVIGRIVKGFRGIGCLPTGGTSDAEWVEDWVDYRYGAKVVCIQRERDLAVLGKKMWRGRDEAGTQERDVVRK